MKEVVIKVDGNNAPIPVESGYIAIRESVDFFLPSATIVFKDRLSGFVSHYPFMQDTEVDISVDDENVVNNYRFFAFSSSKEQVLEGVEAFKFTLDLLSRDGKTLLTGSEFHSKRCTASDYIKYIADKCSLKYEIENALEVRSWINPNWKFSQMIRFVAQRAVAGTGSSGYLYFIRNDGTLVFKTVDKLFDESEVVDITVGSYSTGTEENEEILNNKQFTIKDNHLASVILGANNLDLSIYDYRSGLESSEVVNYEKYLKKRSLIKGVSIGLAGTGNIKYGGTWYSDLNSRPAELNKYIYNKVLRQLESTQVQIMVPLNNALKLGGVVNLSVPANMDLFSGGVNLNYSGKYLIKSIVMVGHGEYMQKLLLVRPGISLPNDRRVKYF